MQLRTIGVLGRLPRMIRLGAIVFSVCLVSQTAFAFNYPLQPEEVRNAYSLGKTTNNEELIKFYNRYVHYFPAPTGNSSIYVQSVEFRTPYEQIVLRTQRNLNTYTTFQADEDYRANPGLVVVRTIVAYKTSYNYVGPQPTAEGFKIAVSQKDAIEPQKITTETICSPLLDDRCTVMTFAVVAWFDAEQFAPGTARIKIETPDGQTIRTKFDLDKLT